MAAIIIPNSTSFGAMTNQMVGRLASLDSTVKRLSEGIATASAGYEGVPGTQFEAPSASGLMTPVSGQNNFGIVPSGTPGEQGESYRYAVDALKAQWDTFWAAAQPYIAALDNGQGSY